MPKVRAARPDPGVPPAFLSALPRRRPAAAFTLIELLVVVSIIALLVSILMPALGHARRQAQGAVCVANQKNLALAWVLYAGDNDGLLVGGHTGAFRFPNGQTYDWVDSPRVPPADAILPAAPVSTQREYYGIMTGRLWAYCENLEAFNCPGDKRATKPALQDPSVMGGYRTYSIAGCMNAQWGKPLEEGGTYTAHTRLNAIKSPADKYVFIEEADGRGFNVNAWVVDPSLHNWNWIDPLAIWHNDSSTLGFADGHAERHRWQDERTIEMAERQTFNQAHPDNPDLYYIKRHWAR